MSQSWELHAETESRNRIIALGMAAATMEARGRSPCSTQIHDPPIVVGRYHSVILSYCSEDTGFAERLWRDLRAHGVNVWWAPQDLAIGRPIRTTINRAIRERDKVLVIMSQRSVRSRWVEQEVEAALEQERLRNTDVIFPVMLDATAFECTDNWAAEIWRTRQVGDFTAWQDEALYQTALARVLRDLQRT